MDSEIVAQAVSPGELLIGSIDLRVPPYQRSFSWTVKEAGDLLSDVSEAQAAGRNHFLGAVVLVGGDDARKGLEVLDGQQRLTTLTILMACLRDMEDNPAEADRLHCLIGRDVETAHGQFRRWRFSLGHTDMMFFREVVQERGATVNAGSYIAQSASRNNILEITESYRERLLCLSGEQRLALGHFVLENCSIVRVQVADRLNGFDVFRVLNTRGLQLSGNDILKSELLEQAGMGYEESVTHAVIWDDYSRRLGPGVFDDLLHQIRTIHDPVVRGPLLQGFRDQVLTQISPRRFFEQVLPRYVEASALLLEIPESQATELEPKSRASLGCLRALEHGGWRAPVLKYLASEPGMENIRKFLGYFECLAYMMQLVVADRDARTRRYRRLIREMDRVEDLFNPESALFLNADERQALITRLHGRISSARQRRALALRLNAALRGGEVIPPESNITLEHVLPRNPGPDSDWMQDWSREEDRRELTDSLGNFALLNRVDNQRADRENYAAKRLIFFGSNKESYALTRDLRRIQEWTPRRVRERRDRLVKRLVTDWGLMDRRYPGRR